MSLTDKTITGIKWSFVDSFANQGMQFIIGIVLARLLSPKEFGLIGIMMVVITISQAFVDSGFSQALIRKNDCREEDYSTVFYFNLLVGVLFYFILFFSAGLIGDFFKEPQLFYLIRVLGIIVIINCIGLIQRTILIKKINFKLQAKISIISTITSGTIGIWMAYTGWGVWSLVWKTLSQNLITTILLWLLNGWKPLLVFSMASFKEMFSFGSRLLTTGLIDALHRNIYNIVIGRFFSVVELGYYSRADEFCNMPSANLYTIINRVTYPALVTVQNDNEKLKKGYKKLIKGTMLISFVFMIGMAVVAEPLILTLIGNKWLPSVPYLQLLCLVGMLWPLHAFNLDVVLIKGRSDLFLQIDVVKRILTIPTIIIGIFFGIKVMIMSMLVNSWLCLFINCYWTGRMIDYPISEQVIDILPSFFVALIMGTGVYITGYFTSFSPMATLIIQIAIGALITVGISTIIRVDAFIVVKEIIFQAFMKGQEKGAECNGTI